MDVLTGLLVFVAAIVLMSASPGPAMALTVRRAALQGFRGAVPTVLGLEFGLYIWAMLAAAGFAALVAASEAAFLALRVAGAVVLVVLGIQAWRAAWRARHSAADRSAEPVAEPTPPAPRRWWAAFAEGVMVQLANPKAAVFMISFYPQFVPADRPMVATTAALATLQVVLETGLYLALAAGVGRAGAWFRRPAIRRRLDALAGTVLISLGLRVATTSR